MLGGATPCVQPLLLVVAGVIHAHIRCEQRLLPSLHMAQFRLAVDD